VCERIDDDFIDCLFVSLFLDFALCCFAYIFISDFDWTVNLFSRHLVSDDPLDDWWPLRVPLLLDLRW
jgi:hypothetical protein